MRTAAQTTLGSCKVLHSEVTLSFLKILPQLLNWEEWMMHSYRPNQRLWWLQMNLQTSTPVQIKRPYWKAQITTSYSASPEPSSNKLVKCSCLCPAIRLFVHLLLSNNQQHNLPPFHKTVHFHEKINSYCILNVISATFSQTQHNFLVFSPNYCIYPLNTCP